MGDEGEGGGVQGVVEVGESADFVLWAGEVVGGIDDFGAGVGERAEEVPGFADFGGDGTGDGVAGRIGEPVFDASHGELHEVAGLGHHAIGETEVFVIERGGGEKGFAIGFPFVVVEVAFGVEGGDEGVVLAERKEAEAGEAGNGFSFFVDDELAGGAFVFPAVDLGPGEDESVKGVGVTGGVGDDVFPFETREIGSIVFFAGERALPIEVHGDAAFADEAAGKGEVRGVFLKIFDG